MPGPVSVINRPNPLSQALSTFNQTTQGIAQVKAIKKQKRDEDLKGIQAALTLLPKLSEQAQQGILSNEKFVAGLKEFIGIDAKDLTFAPTQEKVKGIIAKMIQTGEDVTAEQLALVGAEPSSTKLQTSVQRTATGFIIINKQTGEIVKEIDAETGDLTDLEKKRIDLLISQADGFGENVEEAKKELDRIFKGKGKKPAVDSTTVAPVATGALSEALKAEGTPIENTVSPLQAEFNKLKQENPSTSDSVIARQAINNLRNKGVSIGKE